MKKAITTTPAIAAEAKRTLREETLQWGTLAPAVVSVIVDRIDELSFHDALNIATHAAAVHRIAARFGVVARDDEPPDAAAEFRTAIARLSARLEHAISDVDATGNEELFEDEIAVLNAAAAEEAR
jgi:hypothetical protein